MQNVQTCLSDGSATATIDTCVASCVAAAGNTPAHCRYLEPKWLPDICDMPATIDDFTIATSASLDTNLATSCTGGLVAQAPGPPICVVRAKTINVQAGRTLTVTGPRPIALVADTAVMINGTISAAAVAGVNGPGGGFQTSGTAATTTAGGGGAGFATAGAAGGATATGNGGAAGAILDPLTLAFFAGGPRAGGSALVQNTLGGGGGGAVLLAACRGSVTMAAGSIIDAGGGGGEGQHDTIFGAQIVQSAAGAGGGAGGYVVIEALTGITINGSVFANGGAGGGGNTANDPVSGATGSDGLRNATTQAPGGAGGGTGAVGGRGGVRGQTALPPTAGNGTTSNNGGGGGGAVGVFHFFTPTGVTPMFNSTTTSPLPSARITPTR
jgi:hypothetical protein